MTNSISMCFINRIEKWKRTMQAEIKRAKKLVLVSIKRTNLGKIKSRN